MAPAERVGPEDQKITINLGPVDLGRIDLLVSEGVYSNRTDFIRDAIRDQLENNKQLVDEVITRRSFVIGFVSHSRADLEKCREKGEKLRIRVVGAFRLAQDVTPELADEVIEHIDVLGSLKGPTDVVALLKRKREET